MFNWSSFDNKWKIFEHMRIHKTWSMYGLKPYWDIKELVRTLTIIEMSILPYEIAKKINNKTAS